MIGTVPSIWHTPPIFTVGIMVICHSLHSLSRQVQSLFKSEFSRECSLVLPLLDSSIFSVAAYITYLVFSSLIAFLACYFPWLMVQWYNGIIVIPSTISFQNMWYSLSFYLFINLLLQFCTFSRIALFLVSYWLENCISIMG